MKKYNVAIVGASGLVGKQLLETLEERNFPINSLTLLASEKSAGQILYYNQKPIKIEVLNEDSFKDIDFALFSAGSNISKTFAPIAAAAGAIAIDNTSFFRMQKDIPLIVPEVNGKAALTHKGIIANPNCSTAQLVMALKPIHDEFQIERVVISTYQSVSGAGKEALLELENHSRYNLAGKKTEPKEFSHEIAFNVIPQIDVFLDNGYTKEEMKMIEETKKILDPSINVTATAVRVPVFISHAESVNIQTKKPLTVEKVKTLLESFKGVTLLDNVDKMEFPTPRDVAGKDDVYVGRIREDLSQKNSIDLWIVADNLKKGAALNAVQIAEYLIHSSED